MRLDLFPCTVRLPDGREVREAKVQILDDRRMYVWDVAAGRIRQQHTALIAPDSGLPSPYQSQHVTTDLTLEDGTVMRVQRAGGCGCGNPLKFTDPLAAAGG